MMNYGSCLCGERRGGRKGEIANLIRGKRGGKEEEEESQFFCARETKLFFLRFLFPPFSVSLSLSAIQRKRGGGKRMVNTDTVYTTAKT